MKIRVNDDVGLRVEIGEQEELELVDGEGRLFGLGGRRVVTLCRCGLSANKPFCDASHRERGFVSTVEARDLPPRR